MDIRNSDLNQHTSAHRYRQITQKPILVDKNYMPTHRCVRRAPEIQDRCSDRALGQGLARGRGVLSWRELLAGTFSFPFLPSRSKLPTSFKDGSIRWKRHRPSITDAHRHFSPTGTGKRRRTRIGHSGHLHDGFDCSSQCCGWSWWGYVSLHILCLYMLRCLCILCLYLLYHVSNWG